MSRGGTGKKLNNLLNGAGPPPQRPTSVSTGLKIIPTFPSSDVFPPRSDGGTERATSSGRASAPEGNSLLIRRKLDSPHHASAVAGSPSSSGTISDQRRRGPTFNKTMRRHRQHRRYPQGSHDSPHKQPPQNF